MSHPFADKKVEEFLIDPWKNGKPPIFPDEVISIKRSEDQKKIGRQNNGVLALDIATETGFCTSTASGTWNLAPKKDESKGMRLIRFKGKLKEVCAIIQIRMIVFEQVAMYGKFPNLVAAEMVGVLKLFCEENGIEYKSYPPTMIKKFGTGKGNAKKDAMIEAARKYKDTITSDDEADAVILYHFALEDLNL